MKMGRKTTDYRSLIVVCEGSDTEFNYFVEVSKYVKKCFPDKFVDIKIVPVHAEIITDKNPERKSRGKMQNIKTCHYWCLEEHSQSEYDRFKQQPTRYVREAELYMTDEGYTEAWVVFDHDVHPDHKFAFEYASSLKNLQIAFSSYSFEEWLLLHFERNPFAYSHSDCVDAEKHHINCGTGIHADDCQGLLCIAGRLRKCGYMTSYAKSDQNLFTNYTLPNLTVAMANASWSRSLSSENIFLRNPYTDVDLMLANLLELKPYLWHKTSDVIDILDTTLAIIVTDCSVAILNAGSRTCVLSLENVREVDENFNDVCPFLSSRQILHPGDCVSSEITKGHYIRIEESDKYNIVELLDSPECQE